MTGRTRFLPFSKRDPSASPTSSVRRRVSGGVTCHSWSVLDPDAGRSFRRGPAECASGEAGNGSHRGADCPRRHEASSGSAASSLATESIRETTTSWTGSLRRPFSPVASFGQGIRAEPHLEPLRGEVRRRGDRPARASGGLIRIRSLNHPSNEPSARASGECRARPGS